MIGPQQQDDHPDQKMAEAKVVKCMAQLPSIAKMDNALNVLVACE